VPKNYIMLQIHEKHIPLSPIFTFRNVHMLPAMVHMLLVCSLRLC